MTTKPITTITLSDFLGFTTSTGTGKITRVREIIERGDYHPSHDFWKPLREGIIEFHATGGTDKKGLDNILSKVNSKKHDLYKDAIRAYKRFVGKTAYSLIEAPSGLWIAGELAVRVNPEMILTDGKSKHLLKLYFKRDSLSKSRAALTLELVNTELGGIIDKSTQIGLVDVPRSKLLDYIPTPELRPLLVGEASTFCSIYKELTKKGPRS
jgi:hypothetical protein